MKAVRIHAYGGPDVLTYEDAPRPVIGEDEVLIQVHAAAVNHFAAAVRQGHLVPFFDYSLPLILGWDVSGVIDQVGRGVTNWAAGDAVYARADVLRDGAYAEYIAMRAAHVARKPQSIDHVHAAAIPFAALCAWRSLIDAGGVGRGQSVLIHGAAGGVGTFAVQLAKWRGAHVIGTASGRNLDFLRQLGVDEAIDYTTTRFEDTVRDMDVVLDTVGADTQARSWAALKPGGMLVSMVQAPSEEMAEQYGVRTAFVSVDPDAKTLTEIASLVDAGQIKPVVSTVLPLQKARQAHAMLESRRTRGKIVLQVRN